MYVKPIVWSFVKPGNENLYKGTSNVPCIQIFGYTPERKSVFIKIPIRSTYVVKFVNEVEIKEICEIFDECEMRLGKKDKKVMIFRGKDYVIEDFLKRGGEFYEIKKDPYGEINSFMEYTGMRPYEWSKINKYCVIEEEYTTCDINLIVNEEDIQKAEIKNDTRVRSIFWDIEVYSGNGEFPSAKNEDNEIFMLSVITSDGVESNNYVLVKGNVTDEYILSKKDINIMRVESEKDLIECFFKIIIMYKPDYHFYYNGDTFDMPYIIERANKNKIDVPRMSKILNYSPVSTVRKIYGKFGCEYVDTIKIPGSEYIDMLFYYQKFHPNMIDHKLDTVSKKILGRGKTELKIDEMMSAIKSGDSKKMEEIIKYSYIDALLLKELCERDNIKEKIHCVCNNLSIDINTLLRNDYENIVRKMIYNVEPETCIGECKFSKAKHLKDAFVGAYNNVHVYDYTELYRKIMIHSDDNLTQKISRKLEGAPSKMITTTFYSSHIYNEEMEKILNFFMEAIIGENDIISIGLNVIISRNQLRYDFLEEMGEIKSYIIISKSSNIKISYDDEFIFSGLSKICRPKCKLMENFIKKYISCLVRKEVTSFEIPNVYEEDYKNFVLNEKITGSSKLKPMSVKQRLLEQCDIKINTWIKLDYVVTKKGPILVDKMTENDELDYDYYIGEIRKMLKELKKLKLYN